MQKFEKTVRGGKAEKETDTGDRSKDLKRRQATIDMHSRSCTRKSTQTDLLLGELLVVTHFVHQLIGYHVISSREPANKFYFAMPLPPHAASTCACARDRPRMCETFVESMIHELASKNNSSNLMMNP
jgi:hypothetical protein